MTKIFSKMATIFLTSVFLTACQTNPNIQQVYQQPKMYNTNYNLGIINSINIVNVAEKGDVGVGGAVVGGLAGGVLGNQIGKGNGKKAATVIGALLGAGVGNNIQSNMNTVNVQYYELLVTLHNGTRMKIFENISNQKFYIGQYVKVYQQPRTGHWRAIPD